MANETQDLVFNLRANTSNAEAGMAKVGQLTDDLKITTEKTSGALREFGNQLKNARDMSDVAGMATKALGQVLGASLGGTAILVAGKALFDAFNTIQTAVKETEAKVKDAFKEIDKAGFPKTFEDGATQADKLSAAADAVSKKIQEIEANPLQKFIAGITGAKDKMEELALSTQKAAQERVKLGAQAAISEEEFQMGLSDRDKALNELFKSYQAKADKIAASMLGAGAKPEDIKPIIDQIYNLHTQARDKMLAEYANKESLIEEENARKSSDLKRELAMSEFDLEQKSKERADAAEQARSREALDEIIKKREEEAKIREESEKKIEESQKRLLDLTEKRVALEERIARINDDILKKQAELAKQGAGLGGTMRGPGQRPTSYEEGFNKAVDQATKAAQRMDAQTARNNLQNEMISEKYKTDPWLNVDGMTKAEKNALVSPEAVQIEQKAQAVKAAQNTAIEKGTKELEKLQQQASGASDQLNSVDDESQQLQNDFNELQNETKDLTEAQKNLKEQVQKAVGGGGAKGADTKESILGQIKTLLEQNFNELKAYAHAT